CRFPADLTRGLGCGLVFGGDAWRLAARAKQDGEPQTNDAGENHGVFGARESLGEMGIRRWSATTQWNKASRHFKDRECPRFPASTALTAGTTRKNSVGFKSVSTNSVRYQDSTNFR